MAMLCVKIFYICRSRNSHIISNRPATDKIARIYYDCAFVFKRFRILSVLIKARSVITVWSIWLVGNVLRPVFYISSNGTLWYADVSFDCSFFYFTVFLTFISSKSSYSKVLFFYHLLSLKDQKIFFNSNHHFC